MLDPDAEEIPMLQGKSETIQHVVDYMMEHKGVEPEIIEGKVKANDLSSVYGEHAQFFDERFPMKKGDNKLALYNFWNAGNYLNIPSIVQIAACKIASVIAGLSVDQVKNALDPNYTEPEPLEEKKERSSDDVEELD